MREALFHPEFGYYSENVRTVGAGGDFSTSATLDPNLARAIARWIAERGAGWGTIPVIECGAGTGELARRVLRALPWKTRLRVRYMICETSPSLKLAQRHTLRFRGVSWISSVSQGLHVSKGRALIFSNELADAFPCRVFINGEEGWGELGVRINAEGSLSEAPFGNTLHDDWFRTLSGLPPGHRVERHDSFHAWIKEWAALWKEGAMLTIDYGGITPELQHRSPCGTLRGYWKHRRITGMETYARFGLQDLTADVNFSDLIRLGDLLGWKTLRLSTQEEFVAARCASGSDLGEAAREFLVLEQTPERENPALLT
jgi:SAM-dependent MidA family methyltransferase